MSSLACLLTFSPLGFRQMFLKILFRSWCKARVMRNRPRWLNTRRVFLKDLLNLVKCGRDDTKYDWERMTRATGATQCLLIGEKHVSVKIEALKPHWSFIEAPSGAPEPQGAGAIPSEKLELLNTEHILRRIGSLGLWRLIFQSVFSGSLSALSIKPRSKFVSLSTSS